MIFIKFIGVIYKYYMNFLDAFVSVVPKIITVNEFLYHDVLFMILNFSDELDIKMFSCTSKLSFKICNDYNKKNNRNMIKLDKIYYYAGENGYINILDWAKKNKIKWSKLI